MITRLEMRERVEVGDCGADMTAGRFALAPETWRILAPG